MKNILALLLVVTSFQASSQDSLEAYNRLRTKITLSGMTVLANWGTVNLTVGAVGWAVSKNDRAKYFYQMSTLWGAVNTGVAVIGLTGLRNGLQNNLGEPGSIKAQKKIEKTFLINGGIDFVYIATGIYLNSRGNDRDNVKLKGYGSSVIMQGAFLLLFDAAMYKLQCANGKKMKRFLQKNSVSFSGNFIGVRHSL